MSDLEHTILNAQRSPTSSRDAIRRISSGGRSDSVNVVLAASSIHELAASSLWEKVWGTGRGSFPVHRTEDPEDCETSGIIAGCVYLREEVG